MVVEHDVAGQVFVHGAEAVGDPGTKRGEAHADLAAGEGVVGLDVIVRLREDAANESVFVGQGAKLGEEFADFEAALAVAVKLEGRRHQGPRVTLTHDNVAFT